MGSLRFASVLFLLLSAGAAIGVNYSSSSSASDFPPSERVVRILRSLFVAAVRLLNPNPAAVNAFVFSNISLLLTVPNHLIPSFSANRSAAALWLNSHVLPYLPRSRVALISARSDVVTPSAASDRTIGPSPALLPAIRNIRLALLDLGVRTISVSAAFSSIDVVTTTFPPSAAELLVVRPLLEFLDETNSSFLINLHPYNIRQINSEIPVGFVLFRRGSFNFRDYEITGAMYRNLFEMMVDAIEAAMTVSGEEEETERPSDPKAAAEIYLQKLLKYLRSGSGTPLRKEGAAEVYVYQVFDESTQRSTSNNTSGGAAAGEHGGTMKYSTDFSNSKRILEKFTDRLIVALFILMVLVAWNVVALLLQLLIDLIR